jgi:hypothetical protein
MTGGIELSNAGARNLKHRLADSTSVRAVRFTLWHLAWALAATMTVIGGVILPAAVWWVIWPYDHELARGLWALVAGGWGFVGFIWALGRRNSP